MTKTIDLIKSCIFNTNVVTRSVLKEIIAKRLGCSSQFIQQIYLIGYGDTYKQEDKADV